MEVEPRSLRACQACRIVKVRCNGSPDETCPRCRSAAIPCIFPANRRGRVKGSKNRKTLEREAVQNLEPARRESYGVRGLDNLEQAFPTDSGPEVDIAADSPRDCSLQQPLLFLADSARRGWDTGSASVVNAVPGPLGQLPLEDQERLSLWTASTVPQITRDQSTFFRHGLYGFKRDVGQGLDAVQRGVIRPNDVQPLFASYFRWVHPHGPMLDPILHTPAFVQTRSAYLFAVILALGAVAQATYHDDDAMHSRALQLYAHAENLHMMVCATAVKSVEIVQAGLLFVNYAQRTPRLVDDQRAIRLGMALRMAGMLGLQHAKVGSGPEAQNLLRLRVSLVLHESRWESLSDRNSVTSPFDLTEAEAQEWDAKDASAPDAYLAADYALHCFEIASKRRISAGRSHSDYHCELVYIKAYIAEWREKWCIPQTDALSRWRFTFLSQQSLLVGLLRLLGARTSAGLPPDKIREELYDTAVATLRGALSLPHALHMLRPTTTLVFAATIIWQLSEPDCLDRDMILQLGLRLAGGPSRRDQVMLFARHNGLQLLNMLCLAKRVRVVPAPMNAVPQIDLEQLWTFGGNLAFPLPATQPMLQPWDMDFLPLQPDVGQAGGDWLNMIEDALPMGQWDGLGYQ